MTSRLLSTRLARPLSQRLLLLSSPRTRQPLRHASNSSTGNNSNNPFQSSPSPPRLPPEQQAEFERLQRTANTQEGFNPTSTPTPTPTTPDSPAAAPPAVGVEDEQLAGGNNVPLRKGAPPEFEGEVNPRTGEVGGPKNEPLRWGPAGDYSFNGRVTDF
ncbi:DUF1674-domain-containing protein [Xylariaceae sp. FL0662B]|nr:DUF1674-domain-containing protein [Xylariaceae sp. FL0662B]